MVGEVGREAAKRAKVAAKEAEIARLQRVLDDLLHGVDRLDDGVWDVLRDVRRLAGQPAPHLDGHLFVGLGFASGVLVMGRWVWG